MDPPVRWRRPTGAAKIAKDRPRDRAVFERRRIGPSGCAHRMYGDAPRTVAPHDRPESARGVCAPSKGRSPGSLLFSAPFPERKTSQWYGRCCRAYSGGSAPVLHRTSRTPSEAVLSARSLYGKRRECQMGFTPPPHSEPCAPPRRAAARAPALFGRGTLRYNTLEVHVEHAPKKPKMGEDD